MRGPLATLALIFALGYVLAAVPLTHGQPPRVPPESPGDTQDGAITSPPDESGQLIRLEAENAKLRRDLKRTRRLIANRWRPTVDYALRLASAVYGVSYWELRSVSWCESRFYPYARNGRYLGIFQLGWVPFHRFSPYDPVANALSAAETVRHDGSWRQWECRP